MKNFAFNIALSVAMFTAGAVVATVACSYIGSVNANLIRVAQKSDEQDSTMVTKDSRQLIELELKGCDRKNQKVLCNFLLVNLSNNNQELSLIANESFDSGSRIIDLEGTEYKPVFVQVGSSSGSESLKADLIPDIPIRVALTYKIPSQVSKFKVIETIVADYNNLLTFGQKSRLQFQDVSLRGSTVAKSTNCDNSTSITTKK